MICQDLSRLQSREYICDLERDWDKLLSGDSISDSTIRPVVLDSWRRCKEGSIDPSRAVAPLGIKNSSDELSLSERRMRIITKRSLMSVAPYLEETQSVLISTDRNGQLFFVEGDDALSDNLAANAVTKGATWDEMKIGTNAIGTAIKERRQVIIHGHEHFCVAGKQWSCTADVIRNPSDRSILGVIDLTGTANATAFRAGALITTIVERIENELKNLDLADQLALVECYDNRSLRGSGLLLVDRHGRLIRSNSMKILDHANLEQGEFVPGLHGLAPNKWTRELLHESLRDSEIEWVQKEGELIGAAIHVGRKKRVSPKISVPDALQKFVDVSPSLLELANQAAVLSKIEAPILITGETGVGKEVLSSAIHQSTDRAERPFVAINCSAIPQELIAMELFGYVGGSFTGARSGGMAGRIEDAQGGTLFLDEIGDMPLEAQPYLLRILESGSLTRIGESKEREIDVRIVAATHRPLEELVESGEFRSDLFYRLNVARLHVPPLRDRPADIIPLSTLLLSEIGKGKIYSEIDECTMDFLMSYDYPGNVRELKSFVHRYAVGLPIVPSGFFDKSTENRALADKPKTLAQIEYQAIQNSLVRNNGSVTKVASELGVPRSTLYRRIARTKM